MKAENKKKFTLPFETPPNYFEQLGERLEKRLQGEIEPKGVHKTLPFSLPEKYFEWLPQRIMQKVQNLRRGLAWHQKAHWQWSLRLGVATMLVLAVIWSIPKSDTQTELSKLKENLQKVDKKELEYFLLTHHQTHLEAELFGKNIQLPEMQAYQSDSLRIRKKDLEEVLPDEHIEEVLQQELENSEIL